MTGTLSDPERLILWMELDKPENATGIKTTILELSQGSQKTGSYNPEEWEEMITSILGSDKADKIESPAHSQAPVHSIAPKRKWITWVAAAAAILGVIATGSYIFFSGKPSQIMANNPNPEPTQNDIAPGTSKAILYLANGQKINLESAHNGQLARLGNTNVIKTDSGELLYAATDNTDFSENGLNVLSTPRGGIFKVALPDGTKAWLNAESSITYPTRFTKKQRDVSITGEVYFEVAKDAAHPFVVSLPAKSREEKENGHWMQVDVLGTHFNINDYENEEDGMAKTTLLEGSVKISAHGLSRTIKPGEQAATSFPGKDISINVQADLYKIMAWKNGEMVLSNGNLQKLMREISRWYDVDIEFRGNIPDKKFYGSIDRNVPLSSVLKALKAYGIDTKLEGKKIIVL